MAASNNYSVANSPGVTDGASRQRHHQAPPGITTVFPIMASKTGSTCKPQLGSFECVGEFGRSD